MVNQTVLCLLFSMTDETLTPIGQMISTWAEAANIRAVLELWRKGIKSAKIVAVRLGLSRTGYCKERLVAVHDIMISYRLNRGGYD